MHRRTLILTFLALLFVAIIIVFGFGWGMSSDQEILEDMTKEYQAKPGVNALYAYRQADGTVRMFFQHKQEGVNYALYTRIADGPDDTVMEIPLHYLDEKGQEMFANGVPCPLIYRVAPDGRHIFLLTRVFANGCGWAKEYQLFCIECQTLKATCIATGAAAEARENGIVMVVATERKDAEGQSEWVMHEEQYDWDGHLAEQSKKTFTYDEMKVRFADEVDQYEFVKGFAQCQGPKFQ